MSHQLTYTTIVPGSKGIGESDFENARAAIVKRYGVAPIEVFLDSVQTEGVVKVSDPDFEVDLGVLGLRLLGFGGDPETVPAPTPSADAPAPTSHPSDVLDAVSSTTTTTTV